jgi:hypothetical protein
VLVPSRRRAEGADGDLMLALALRLAHTDSLVWSAARRASAAVQSRLSAAQPNIGTFQALLRLVRSAFIKATIPKATIPGFHQQEQLVAD